MIIVSYQQSQKVNQQMPVLKTRCNSTDLSITGKKRRAKASIKDVLSFLWQCSPVGLSVLESLKKAILT